MTKPLLLTLPDNAPLTERLAKLLAWPQATIALHRFPDGESLVSVPAALTGRRVVIVASLDQPDSKTLPLLFAADACRDMGAALVGLVAPYLGYLRQDQRFHPGEAISSRSYAGLLSGHFDCLLTVDPHLHRYHSLDEIYRLRARHLSAAPAIADWIRQAVARPLLIGPDSESAQWVASVADRVGAPYIVLAKDRRGDRQVSISPPDVSAWRDHTPVILDDILSTARTMAGTVQRLLEAGMAAPVCIAVHALFAGDAEAALRASGPARIVTCNTVAHPSNAIDVAPLLAAALPELLASCP